MRSPLAAVYRGYAWLVDRVSHEKLGLVRDAVARRLGVPAEKFPDLSAYAVLPAAWQAVINDCPPELLSKLTCPVLIINGQFDQMRINERRYRSLAREAYLATVPRATHLAPLTHPDQVGELLQEFITAL